MATLKSFLSEKLKKISVNSRSLRICQVVSEVLIISESQDRKLKNG